jgi:predicted DNA-binding helix-hairpin-helix protein
MFHIGGPNLVARKYMEETYEMLKQWRTQEKIEGWAHLKIIVLKLP